MSIDRLKEIGISSDDTINVRLRLRRFKMTLCIVVVSNNDVINLLSTTHK